MSKNHIDDAVRRALGGVYGPDGGGDYYYRAEETDRWYRVDADALGRLAAALRSDSDGTAYSEWCQWYGEEVCGTEHDILDRICDLGGPAEGDYVCQCGKATGERCGWSGHRTELHRMLWVPDSDRGSARASGTYTHGAYAYTLYVSPPARGTYPTSGWTASARPGSIPTSRTAAMPTRCARERPPAGLGADMPRLRRPPRGGLRGLRDAAARHVRGRAVRQAAVSVGVDRARRQT